MPFDDAGVDEFHQMDLGAEGYQQRPEDLRAERAARHARLRREVREYKPGRYDDAASGMSNKLSAWWYGTMIYLVGLTGTGKSALIRGIRAALYENPEAVGAAPSSASAQQEGRSFSVSVDGYPASEQRRIYLGDTDGFISVAAAGVNLGVRLKKLISNLLAGYYADGQVMNADMGWLTGAWRWTFRPGKKSRCLIIAHPLRLCFNADEQNIVRYKLAVQHLLSQRVQPVVVLTKADQLDSAETRDAFREQWEQQLPHKACPIGDPVRYCAGMQQAVAEELGLPVESVFCVGDLEHPDAGNRYSCALLEAVRRCLSLGEDSFRS